MYRIVHFVIKPEHRNWEGAIIEDVSTRERYITNGIYKWKLTDAKLSKLKIVPCINKDKFLVRWNSRFFNGELVEG